MRDKTSRKGTVKHPWGRYARGKYSGHQSNHKGKGVPSASAEKARARIQTAQERKSEKKKQKRLGEKHDHHAGDEAGTGDGDRGSPGEAKSVTNRKKICFRCRKYGHLLRDCRGEVYKSTVVGNPPFAPPAISPQTEPATQKGSVKEKEQGDCHTRQEEVRANGLPEAHSSAHTLESSATAGQGKPTAETDKLDSSASDQILHVKRRKIKDVIAVAKEEATPSDQTKKAEAKGKKDEASSHSRHSNCTDIDSSSYSDKQTSGSSLAKKSSTLSEAQFAGLCFNCGDKNHTIWACPRGKPKNGLLPFARCFVCKETGHLSSHCKLNGTGIYPRGGNCRRCGSIYHLSANCLKPQSRTKISTLPTTPSAKCQSRSADSDDWMENHWSNDSPSSPPKTTKCQRGGRQRRGGFNGRRRGGRRGAMK